MNDDSNVPVRINQYWEQKKEKIDEIIESLESLRAWTRYVPSAIFHDRFTAILIKLHQFKEEGTLIMGRILGVKYNDVILSCHSCGIAETSLRKNGKRYSWYLNIDENGNAIGRLCAACYDKYIHIKYRNNNKEKLNSRASRYHRLDFAYRDKIFRGFHSRTGQCSKCPNNIHDGSCKKTHMHHWTYIIICPWFGREEVCPSCHVKETWKGWHSLKARIRK